MRTLDKLISFFATTFSLLFVIGLFTLLAAIQFPELKEPILFGGVLLAFTVLITSVFKDMIGSL